MVYVPEDDLQYVSDTINGVVYSPRENTSVESSIRLDGVILGSVGIREASASGGTYQVSDVVARFRKPSGKFSPEVGGTIFVPGYYDSPLVVLGVTDGRLSNTWRIVCERLDGFDKLRQYATVERAVVKYDEDHAPYTSFVPLAERVPVSIALVTRSVERSRSAKRVDSEYRILMSYPVADQVKQLLPNDRVVTEDSSVYILNSVTYNLHVPSFQILKAYGSTVIEGDS